MKELKFGESGWFETRNGRRAFVCHSGVKPFCLFGSIDNSDNENWKLNGDFATQLDDKGHSTDLVRHLPDCTGWDWVEPEPEPKYRPFANADEVMPYVDKLVKLKSSVTGIRGRIASFDDVEIRASIYSVAISYKAAFQMFEFFGGLPFGIQVNCDD